MFGMLDYRAHKLYKLLFFIPNTILWLLATFVFPFVCYAIGFKFSDFIVWQILLAIVAYFVVGLVWSLFVKLYVYLTNELFTLIVDVVPADGRNEDEAKAVVFGGKFVVDILNLEKNIGTADDELIERIASHGFFSIFFREKIRDRLYFMRDYYKSHPDQQPSEWHTENVLDENNLSMSNFEKILTNGMYRGWALQTMVFALLIVYRPVL